jgi:hypothetical protein
VVTTSTKSPALLRSQLVNGDTTFATEPKQPSSATDRIYSFKVALARTNDDFQGFEADNASKVRPETTPNHQAFVNSPHASQTFAYPGFTHTVDQKWTAALLKVMDNINVPDYAFGLILAWARGASAEEYSFHPQGARSGSCPQCNHLGEIYCQCNTIVAFCSFGFFFATRSTM